MNRLGAFQEQKTATAFQFLHKVVKDLKIVDESYFRRQLERQKGKLS